MRALTFIKLRLFLASAAIACLGDLNVYAASDTSSSSSGSPCTSNGQINCATNSSFVAGAPVQKDAQAPNGTSVYVPSIGYYDGAQTVTTSDSNLLSNYIAGSVSIFGMAGSLTMCTASNQTGCITTAGFSSQSVPSSAASAADVLAGNLFYVGGTVQTGTLTNLGALDVAVAFSQPGYVSSITGLTHSKVCSTSNLLGSPGTAGCVVGTTGNLAPASEILAGFEAWNAAGAKITGTMTNRGTLDESSAFLAGFYDGTVSNAPSSGQICSGTTIFGTSGTRTCPTTGWTSTGASDTQRSGHTATLLNNGQVLFTGGDISFSSGSLSSASLYNPQTGTFAATGSMSTPRNNHRANLLASGKVFITGGFQTGDPTNGWRATTEIYDPQAGTFSAGPTMASRRGRHTATLLPDGRVLVVGGNSSSPSPTNTAEVYNPSTNTFSAVIPMNRSRSRHAAVLLRNGKTLVVGGWNGGSSYESSSELYDPQTNAFSTGTLPTMSNVRQYLTATLLTNGKVLVAGGDDNTQTFATADLYDPNTDTFTPTGNMTIGRTYHSAILLPNGKVLIAGGWEDNFNPSQTAELYDPQTGTFTATGSMVDVRYRFAATLLINGQVLVMGGSYVGGATPNAELFSP